MTEARPVSHRRRILIGLAIAALLGAALIHAGLVASRAGERRATAERLGIVRAQALAQTLDRAGTEGDPAREVARLWSASDPTIRSIRVIAFSGIRLEASTASADAGDHAAPRRLEREEKPLYDQGQRLRAAHETNVQEGAARKAEIEIEDRPGGALEVAAPLESGGDITGMLAVTAARPPTPERGPVPLDALLGILLPVALFLAAGRFIGERRIPLFVTAVVLLSISLGALGYRAASTLAATRRATEETVSAATQAELARAASVIGDPALAPAFAAASPAPIAASDVDVDVYRRPYGGAAPGSAQAAARLDRDVSEILRAVRRVTAGVLATALLLLAFVGLGGAERVAGTLRRHRVAYLYVLPAVIGTLVLVFFPFLYGITISFTDDTLYNTSKPLSEIWIGLRNYGDILGDFGVVRRAGDGSLVFNYLNFYWTLLFTVALDRPERRHRPHGGAGAGAGAQHRSCALRAALPRAPDPALGHAQLHHGADLEGHVPPAVRGREPDPAALRGSSRSPWFGSCVRPSFAANLATNSWLGFPFMMVVSLGALRVDPERTCTRPPRVDGASRWQQFRHDHAAARSSRALFPAIILSVVWTFNMFNIIYLVSERRAGQLDRHPGRRRPTSARSSAYRYGYGGRLLDDHLRDPARLRAGPEPRRARHGGAFDEGKAQRRAAPARTSVLIARLPDPLHAVCALSRCCSS